MDKIKIMVSSTVKDLEGERQSITEILSKYDFVELCGAAPYTTSSISSSSMLYTKDLAEKCDLYILILGSKFGYTLEDGRSATEFEFDAAYHSDPTKILVMKKETDTKVEKKQQRFIKRVTDYYTGYWRATFKYTHELQTIVVNSFWSWLKDRASFGSNFTYLDHFVRLALQKKPTQDTLVLYCVKENYVEIEYSVFQNTLVTQFDKLQIYKDFWGSLYNLESQISNWIKGLL